MSLYYKNRKISKVGFVGFGISNSALYERLKASYPTLSFSVRLPREKIATPIEKCYTGAHFLDNIDEDVLFFSPSIKRENVPTGPILSSECEFFFETNAARVYAVSGSDGKSTTASIASSILGDGTALCGNIGVPMCNFCGRGGNIVAELSSFQLNYFSPRVYSAVLTTLSENHLDFHKSLEAYLRAKENLLKNAENTALWLDGDTERAFIKKYLPKTLISFNLTYGECTRLFDAESYITVENGVIMRNGAALADARGLYTYGEYTVKNLMSAIALTNAECEAVRRAIENFKPLYERCTLLKENGGISYYSSSIDSSPQRTATTLSRFTRDVVLIIGGRGKGLDLAPLKSAVKGKVKAIFAYGECGEMMLCELCDAAPSDTHFHYERDFEASVRMACEYAEPGDSVLLSPAATSYDCFRDYRERAEKYKEIINKI